ncbi:MAG: substrate-binding domain-containing protein [Betaproteobacteria bacterium]
MPSKPAKAPDGAPSPDAPFDLVLLSAGAAKGLVLGVAAEFLRTTGSAIRGTFGAVGAMREKLLSGNPCDAFVSTAAMLDALAQDGRVLAASIRPIGLVRTGIAVRAGDPSPAVADGDALAACLEAAPAIFVPDTERATAGIHFVRVLDRLGLLAALAPRLRAYASGAIAMQALAHSGIAGAIGCTQVTEILYTPGVVLAARLPGAFELATPYAAGVTADAASPALATTFVARIAGERAAALRREGGFEG